MNTVDIHRDPRNFLAELLDNLLSTGWLLHTVPHNGKVPRNGMLLRLLADDLEINLRIFIYKVTTSGRNRTDERRIQITSTYKSGLKRKKGFSDVVIGVEGAEQKYVGVDSRRLSLGGATHNASSFFDIEGLSVPVGDLLINPRITHASVFKTGVEHHSFFDASRLAEYLFNHRTIHVGDYSYNGTYSGRSKYRKKALPISVDRAVASGDVFILAASKFPIKFMVNLSDVKAQENGLALGNKKRKISPEELKKIQATCEENGRLGEQLVMDQERKRLRLLGHLEAAKRVERVSLTSVSEGYDILSFEDDGHTRRFLEVKSTVGKGWIVDISLGEWSAAQRLRSRYYLVRVVNLKKTPQIVFFQDPCRLVQDNRASKTEAGWRLNLKHSAVV